MIRYALKCSNDHGFESWFQSAAAFDTLASARRVACPDCGDADVRKAPMAPQLGAAPASAGTAATPPAQTRPSAAQRDPRAAAFAEFRRQVEANSDYVGGGFAAEARRIHEGQAPARPIYGEARAEEARKLFEDGVPVAPLPFLPTRKVN